MKIQKGRNIWEIAALFFLFVIYNLGGIFWDFRWLPSHTNLPLTDIMIDKFIFFFIILLSAARFKTKGGIIATLIGVSLMILVRIFQDASLDVVLQLIASGVFGIVIAFVVGGYVSTQEKLVEALASVKTLSGLIPICSSCKKIRDDKGYWEAVEHYVKEHTSAEFTHSICPDCIAKLYPDLTES